MEAVQHLDPAFYAVSTKVFEGSVLDRPVTQCDVADLGEQILGWRPRVVLLQEQTRPIAFADSDARRLSFSPSALVLSHALHEIAHLIVGVKHAHGTAFVAAFSALVARFGTPELADELRAEISAKKPAASRDAGRPQLTIVDRQRSE